MKLRITPLLVSAALATAGLAKAQLVIDFEDAPAAPNPGPFVQTPSFDATVTTVNVSKGNSTSDVLYVRDTDSSSSSAAAGNYTITGNYTNPTQVFFHFYAVGVTGNRTNTAFWLNSAPTLGTRHVGFGADTGFSGTWYTFNGTTQTALEAPSGLLGLNKWLEVRMDITYGNNTFSLFARELGNSTWTQLTSNSGSVTSWGFRNSGNFTSISQIFITSASNNATAASSGVGSYTDNIVIVPEPSVVALLLMSGAGLAYMIRRRRFSS